MCRQVTWKEGDPTFVAFRLLLSLAWGAPFRGAVACHMACDNCLCLNPAHGRWGTHRQNQVESYVLRAWRYVWRHAPVSVRDLHPSNPARYRLWVQHFPGITVNTPVM